MRIVPLSRLQPLPLLAGVLAALPACSRGALAPLSAPALPAPMVFHASDVPPPTAGAISQRDPVQSRHVATRVMRLAPAARLPLHHHAGYDETFTVLEGALALELDGRRHDVQRGDVVIIPAGTTITGTNGAAESTVVVVWANTGTGTQLTTPGANPGRVH